MGRCERLKWNRRNLGMTQEELAKKVGVSAGTISRLETDETAWAYMRDSTTDGIYNTLRDLASWQCDIHSVFKDNVGDEEICELRKKVQEKRLSLGMSQKDLGMMLGLTASIICKYEKHDNMWKSKRSLVPHKLVEFVNGKYDALDAAGDSVTEEIIMEEQTEMLPENETVHIVTKTGSAEDTLNTVIDILQERMAHAVDSGEDVKVYAGMISGVCEGYLQYR